MTQIKTSIVISVDANPGKPLFIGFPGFFIYIMHKLWFQVDKMFLPSVQAIFEDCGSVKNYAQISLQVLTK